jgi:hypothetical protein
VRHWHALAAAAAVLVAGCGTLLGAPAPAAPVSSAPAPVSTSATLTSSCVMGYASVQLGQDGSNEGYAGFTAGPPQGTTGPPEVGFQTSPGAYYAPDMAFQMTLANSGSVTAQVSQIAVAFYANGAEQGSTTAGATGFITPGQSLTWTVRSPLAVDGTGTGDQGNQAESTIPATADSCSLVQWSEGP